MLSYLEHSVPAREAAEFLGAALPLLLFLSPLPLVVAMCRTKKVGNTPPLPFIAGLGTNVLWLLAGVGMNKTAMIVPNAFGLCLHFCYVVVYYLALKSELATVAAATTKEAPRSKTPTKADTKRSRSRSPMKKAAGASSPMKKTEAAGGGASASSTATKYATGNAALLATRSSFVRLMLLAAVAITVGAVGLVTGYVDVTSGLASALNILMMGAPAAALRTVWKTWDPSHLGSASMAVAGLNCSFVWSLIGGIWWKNAQVFVPNILGVITNGIALFFFLWIGFTNRGKKKKTE